MMYSLHGYAGACNGAFSGMGYFLAHGMWFRDTYLRSLMVRARGAYIFLL
jgi:hypothetical protein